MNFGWFPSEIQVFLCFFPQPNDSYNTTDKLSRQLAVYCGARDMAVCFIARTGGAGGGWWSIPRRAAQLGLLFSQI